MIVGGGGYSSVLAAIQAADSAGRRQVRVTAAISFEEARALCLMLPTPARPTDPHYPIGWGVFPPEASPVVVVFGADRRAANGDPVPAGHEAMILCFWNVRGRILGRFQSTGYNPGEARIVDGYMDDIVAEVRHIRGHPKIKHGWEINRLDPVIP